MTTQTKQFPPKKLVPVGESIIVHWGGKPPKVTTREYQGKPITEVTWWMGIADKNYPDLIGQYHPFTVRPWIAPGKPGNPTTEPPVPPTQPSKLYKTLAEIAGKEKAEEFTFHDASILETDIEAADDDNRERLKGKHITPDQWKALRGFYVAVFKEPRKIKGTQEPMIADDGGIFRQEIVELKPLKAARIFTEEELKRNIIWPPPEYKPEGQSQTSQTTPKQEDKPKEERKPFQPKPEPTPEALPTILEIIKGWCLIPDGSDYRRVTNRFLRLKLGDGAKMDGLTKEADIRHLYALLRIQKHALATATLANQVTGHLQARKCELQQLDFEDAVFLLAALDKAADDDVPF